MTNARDDLIRLMSEAVGLAGQLSADLLAEAGDIMRDIQVPVRLYQSLTWRADGPTITVTGPATIEAVENMSADSDISISVRIQRARNYATIRREHWESIYGAVVGYLDTSLPVTSYRNLAGRAVIEHYTEAFQAAYEESSGGDTIAAEDDQWLTDAINSGVGYVADLFNKLKDVRKAGGYDADAIAQARADGYATTLDSVYGHGRILGNTNVMLTFAGPDGKESCAECQKYKGQRHRGKWWLARDLVRRNGNENFGCGRWPECHHNLYKDNGELWSV